MTLSFTCRRSDPLTGEIRRQFNAHPVRVPSAHVVPLLALADDDGTLHSLGGPLASFVGGTSLSDLVVSPPSPMATVEGVRSGEMKGEVALTLLDGLAKPLGLTGPQFEAALGRETSLTFAFTGVTRTSIDVGLLGRALKGQKLDNNPSTQSFLREDDPADLLVIDSTIRATSMTVGWKATVSGEAGVDLGSVQKLLGDVAVGVSGVRNTSTSISFDLVTPLTFAFSAQRVRTTADATIVSLEPVASPEFLDLGHDDELVTITVYDI